MVLHTCPYNPEAPHFAGLPGTQNLVALHQCAEDYVAPHSGPFSVKYVLNGTEYYETEGRHLAATPQHYLVLNKGQEYASRISGPASSFCVFFSDDLVAGYCRDTAAGAVLLPDGPSDRNRQLYLQQQCYSLDEQSRQLLQAFRQGDFSTQLALDEWCLQWLSLLGGQQLQEWKQMAALNTVRPATRQELYRRLACSVDHMQQHYAGNITLADLSTAACLSEYHFHRLFKAAFRISPYQYLTRLRLQQASALLKHSQFSLAAICLSCGFEDKSAFIRLFKRYYGITPGAYRLAAT